MADGQGRTTLISDFRGQNHHLPDTLLPPNVSPDALNCDFWHNTVMKREGWSLIGRFTPGSDCESVILGIWLDPASSRYVYIVVATKGATFYDLTCYRVNTGLVGSATLMGTTSDAIKALWPFRAQNIEGVGLWGEWKLPNWHKIAMDPVDVSLTTATPGGTGSLNGVRQYYVVARNSTDGHESDLDYSNLPGSAIVTSWSAENAARFDIVNIPVSSDPQVDKKRIYATKTGGTVFYYLADISNGVTSYTDTTPDSDLTVPYNGYRGIIPTVYGGTNRRTPILWQERLWALGYENGNHVYKWTERSYGDGLPLYCLWYPYNYLTLRGVHSAPWDVIAVDDSYLLIASSDGLFAIVGDNPANYRCVPIVTGHIYACLALSATYCYAAGPHGIVRFPRGSLGPVEKISQPVENFCSDMVYDHSGQRKPVAGFAPGKGQVMFSFTNRNGVLPSEDFWNERPAAARVTLVWDETKGEWSVWDLPVDQYGSYRFGYINYVGLRGILGCLRLSPYEDAVHSTDGQTETGTVSSSTPTTVVVSNSPVLHNIHYAGLTLHVTAPDGAIQRRVIKSRSGTTITVTKAWTANPTDQYTYQIGGIDWHWYSPRLALTEDRFALKRTHRIKTAFRQNPNLNLGTMAFAYRFDDNAEQTKTLDASKRLEEVLTDDVGRELRLSYTQNASNMSVEIEGIQIELEQQE